MALLGIALWLCICPAAEAFAAPTAVPFISGAAEFRTLLNLSENERKGAVLRSITGGEVLDDELQQNKILLEGQDVAMPLPKAVKQSLRGREATEQAALVVEVDGTRVATVSVTAASKSSGPESEWQWQVSSRTDVAISIEVATLMAQALYGWLAPPDYAFQSKLDQTRMQETLDWVDEEGRIICPVPRATIHRHNLLHRGAGVMVTGAGRSKVYCHRRTTTKRVFPGMYDMFIGGCCDYLELPQDAALREVREELGLAKQASTEDLHYRFTCTVNTPLNRCVVAVYDYEAMEGEEVTHQAEEVDWGSFLTWQEVEVKLNEGEWEWVPDGLQVWDEYRKQLPIPGCPAEVGTS
ncbi:unnamed protein product [Chrysoparadoxa australica]